MTKKTIRPTESASDAKTPEVVVITRDTAEAEVIRFESEGKRLSFTVGEDFKELPESVAVVLSHENARNYFMALGEQKARKKAGPLKPMIEQIIDPLVGHEEARLAFKSDGTAAGAEFLKKNWLAWEFCTTVDGFVQKGYKQLTDEEPIIVGIPSNASHHYLTKDTQGRDELMLLYCPMEMHKQHEKAVAGISRQRIEGARGEFEGRMDKLGVKVMKETDEDHTVEKVRVNRDTVDRAFLADKK